MDFGDDAPPRKRATAPGGASTVDFFAQLPAELAERVWRAAARQSDPCAVIEALLSSRRPGAADVDDGRLYAMLLSDVFDEKPAASATPAQLHAQLALQCAALHAREGELEQAARRLFHRADFYMVQLNASKEALAQLFDDFEEALGAMLRGWARARMTDEEATNDLIALVPELAAGA